MYPAPSGAAASHYRDYLSFMYNGGHADHNDALADRLALHDAATAAEDVRERRCKAKGLECRPTTFTKARLY